MAINATNAIKKADVTESLLAKNRLPAMRHGEPDLLFVLDIKIFFPILFNKKSSLY
jgi:hypothetical protein